MKPHKTRAVIGHRMDEETGSHIWREKHRMPVREMVATDRCCFRESQKTLTPSLAPAVLVGRASKKVDMALAVAMLIVWLRCRPTQSRVHKNQLGSYFGFLAECMDIISRWWACYCVACYCVHICSYIYALFFGVMKGDIMAYIP